MSFSNIIRHTINDISVTLVNFFFLEYYLEFYLKYYLESTILL